MYDDLYKILWPEEYAARQKELAEVAMILLAYEGAKHFYRKGSKAFKSWRERRQLEQIWEASIKAHNENVM